MDLTFRTLGAWGAGKGANLDAGEVDNNFWSLAEAIVALQNDPTLPVGIASISVSGTEMTITLTDGSVMGPFPMPVLTFRWRGEYESGTSYAALDVFTVSAGNASINPATVRYGIFMVQIAGTYGIFDPDEAVGGEPAYLQLFGSIDTLLSTLGDVELTPPEGPPGDRDVLLWSTASGKWVNSYLGTMGDQDASNVLITGGQIHGMSAPVSPDDVATKAYVDSLPAGMTSPVATMMANLGPSAGPAVPVLLSDYLDVALSTSTRGTLLYRGGPGWIALPPGTAGLFLQTHDAGSDPTWAVGASGVTTITAGTGIDTTPDTITSSGTIALAPIADANFLANASGVSAVPTPTTLSAFLDHVLTSNRGTLLTRTIGGWVALSPGATGQYLKSLGTGADLTWDSPIGAGTVTSVAAGTGLTTGGSPITSTGTVSLAAIADLSVLANTSGSSAAPVATTTTLLLDRAFGSTQGAVLYRGASAWGMLTPGTSGQVLTTGGAAANVSWANTPAAPAIATARILANISGSTAVPIGNTLSNILDAVLGSSRGMIMYRSNSAWAALSAGTSGQYLQQGPSGDPRWATVTGGSGGGATNLDGLSDVTLTTPAAYDQLVFDGATSQWLNQRAKYIVGSYAPGTPTANQNLLFHRFSKAVTIPANAGTYLGHVSEAAGSVAATASTVVTIAKALSGTPTTFAGVATITFAAGSAVGTFATSGGTTVTFAQGDILRLQAAATPDATLADFHMTLVGFES
jgi:hypothetical protein